MKLDVYHSSDVTPMWVSWRTAWMINWVDKCCCLKRRTSSNTHSHSWKQCEQQPVMQYLWWTVLSTMYLWWSVLSMMYLWWIEFLLCREIYVLRDLICCFECCYLGLFSICGWARSQPMREDITYGKSSFIGCSAIDKKEAPVNEALFGFIDN